MFGFQGSNVPGLEGLGAGKWEGPQAANAGRSRSQFPIAAQDASHIPISTFPGSNVSKEFQDPRVGKGPEREGPQGSGS